MPTVELHYGDTSASSGTHSIIATHLADNGCPSGLQYTIGTFSGPATSLVASAVRHLDVPGLRWHPVQRELAHGGPRSPRLREHRRPGGLTVIGRRRPGASRPTRSRRARDERGQTLFEVIVVVFLLGIVLVMVYDGDRLGDRGRSVARRSGSRTSTRRAP